MAIWTRYSKLLFILFFTVGVCAVSEAAYKINTRTGKWDYYEGGLSDSSTPLSVSGASAYYGGYEIVNTNTDQTGGGGGAGAYTGNFYIVGELESDLTQERVLAVDATNFVLTDSGAQANYTIGLKGGKEIPTTTEKGQYDTAYTHSQDNTQAHSDYLIDSDLSTNAQLVSELAVFALDTDLSTNAELVSELAVFALDTDLSTNAELVSELANNAFSQLTISNHLSVDGDIHADTLYGDGSNITGLPSGVTDHGALTGLSDDDHSIYPLQDGSEANDFTGDVDIQGSLSVSNDATVVGTFMAGVGGQLTVGIKGVQVNSDEGLGGLPNTNNDFTVYANAAHSAGDLVVQGGEGGSANFHLQADDSDEGSTDRMSISKAAAGNGTIANFGSTYITLSTGGVTTFAFPVDAPTFNSGSGDKDLGDNAVANGDTGSVPTNDQVFDFVMSGDLTNGLQLNADLTDAVINMDLTDGLNSTDLDDTAAILYETELDDFSELQAQISDKTMVNEEDAITFDSIITMDADLTIKGDLSVGSVMMNDMMLEFNYLSPSGIVANLTDSMFIWHNDTGVDVTVVEVNAWATGYDDSAFTVMKRTAAGTQPTTIDAINCTTGSDPYTDNETTITAATVENGYTIWLLLDATDAPTQLAGEVKIRW